jgi:thiol:disulfide interchange protein
VNQIKICANLVRKFKVMMKIKNSIVIASLSVMVIVLFSFVHSSSANKLSGGIKFSKMSISKAMGQAKKSGKIIFIDVHTSWCGPCKEMARTTFQDGEVAKAFNDKFINLKIDAEQDEDGPAIAKKYAVNAYPTLLWVNSEGKLVKKVVGKQSKDKLLSLIEKM